jgi:hypothetical protein
VGCNVEGIFLAPFMNILSASCNDLFDIFHKST